LLAELVEDLVTDGTVAVELSGFGAILEEGKVAAGCLGAGLGLASSRSAPTSRTSAPSSARSSSLGRLAPSGA
jgi:hypothetical protein